MTKTKWTQGHFERLVSDIDHDAGLPLPKRTPPMPPVKPPKPESPNRAFRVATFYDPDDNLCKTNIAAYTRDYNEKWSGCKMYTIEAASGTEAKKQAQLRRFLYEKACREYPHQPGPDDSIWDESEAQLEEDKDEASKQVMRDLAGHKD